jgi:Zn finger protein HypA/HybF involved in hydrogenase expression
MIDPSDNDTNLHAELVLRCQDCGEEWDADTADDQLKRFCELCNSHQLIPIRPRKPL